MSPILFNVFLSDLFDKRIVDASSRIGVYADGICLTAIGDTAQQAAERLSQVLSRIDNWGHKNRAF